MDKYTNIISFFELREHLFEYLCRCPWHMMRPMSEVETHPQDSLQILSEFTTINFYLSPTFE